MQETGSIAGESKAADSGSAAARSTLAVGDDGTTEKLHAVEARQIAEENITMLDVHPAHHAATTWREFFVHIATIVLGLIIAVGLEQGVEYIHHRSEAREARENIQREMADNLVIVERNQAQIDDTQRKLARNLDLLNSNAPDAEVLPQLGMNWELTRTHDAAWNAAKVDGSLALIPPGQIGKANYFYQVNNDLAELRFAYFTDMDTIEVLIVHDQSSGRMTSPERQLLLSLTVSAMGRGQLISQMYTNQIDALRESGL